MDGGIHDEQKTKTRTWYSVVFVPRPLRNRVVPFFVSVRLSIRARRVLLRLRSSFPPRAQRRMCEGRQLAIEDGDLRNAVVIQAPSTKKP